MRSIAILTVPAHQPATAVIQTQATLKPIKLNCINWILRRLSRNGFRVLLISALKQNNALLQLVFLLCPFRRLDQRKANIPGLHVQPFWHPRGKLVGPDQMRDYGGPGLCPACSGGRNVRPLKIARQYMTSIGLLHQTTTSTGVCSLVVRVLSSESDLGFNIGSDILCEKLAALTIVR